MSNSTMTFTTSGQHYLFYNMPRNMLYSLLLYIGIVSTVKNIEQLTLLFGWSHKQPTKNEVHAMGEKEEANGHRNVYIRYVMMVANEINEKNE